jgi:hypothetical protein
MGLDWRKTKMVVRRKYYQSVDTCGDGYLTSML